MAPTFPKEVPFEVRLEVPLEESLEKSLNVPLDLASKPRNPVEKLNDELEKFRKNKPYISLISEEFANCMDENDELRKYRSRFEFPLRGTLPNGDPTGDPQAPCVYMCGNSLGLKPRQADLYMSEQLAAWGSQAVLMHFNGRIPGTLADQLGKRMTARLVGAASRDEVSIMNGLTVNLQLLMLAFYQPSGERNKILIEDHAFPSDRYAVRSLLKVKGVPEDCMVLVKPRPGEDTIRTEDILETIRGHEDSLALVMLSGVQYYTGQLFDIPAITAAGHEVGAVVGWDLAHAIANVDLQLTSWNVDFAVWCSYKYLNSGAGGIAGAFVHNKHHGRLPAHLEGWWSNAQDTRFEMRDRCDPAPGADAFRLSNPPIWLLALNLASLEIFEEVGMSSLLNKQFTLTGYLEHLLTTKLSTHLRIITPRDPGQRGCQLSLMFTSDLKAVHETIQRAGVICDVRGNVMRIAPAPLYNSYKDVWDFVDILNSAITSVRESDAECND